MKHMKLIFSISLFLGFACFVGAAQELTKAGEFSSLDSDVQVIPGPLVIVHADVVDGKDNVYALGRSGRFLKVNRKPRAYKWNSFNWADIDFLDQINRADFESAALAALVPSGGKVKGFAQTAGSRASRTLIFVCYAMPSENSLTPEQRDLHIAMLVRGPLSANTTYERLGDVKAAEASYFGSLTVQRQRDGIFIALYSASAGGASHQTHSVAVYRVTEDTQR